MVAPPDDEEGQLTTSVMLIASGYTTRADGQMDFAGFTALVGDLLCLRDDCTHAAPERMQQVAIALAAHVRMVDGQQSQTIDLMLIVDLVVRWAELMGRPDVIGAGGERLPSPATPGLPERLAALRELRRSAEAAPMWVYTHEKCRGSPVGESILSGHDGWRFADHVDGTGIVYFWPPEGAPDREAMLRGGIHALPVAQLGTSAAPVPAEATHGTLPLPAAAAISTPRLRRVESPATLTMLRQSSEKAAALQAATLASSDQAAVTAALRQQAAQAAQQAAVAQAAAAARLVPQAAVAARAPATGATAASSVPSPPTAIEVAAPPPAPPPPLTAEEAAEMVDARLLSLRLRPVDVGGGGNCFFRALACAAPPPQPHRPPPRIPARPKPQPDGNATARFVPPSPCTRSTRALPSHPSIACPPTHRTPKRIAQPPAARADARRRQLPPDGARLRRDAHARLRAPLRSVRALARRRRTTMAT